VLLVREVQPELDERDVIINEQSLELHDLLARALGGLFVDETFDTFDEETSVPRRSKTVMPPVPAM